MYNRPVCFHCGLLDLDNLTTLALKKKYADQTTSPIRRYRSPSPQVSRQAVGARKLRERPSRSQRHPRWDFLEASQAVILQNEFRRHLLATRDYTLKPHSL
ncbi:hypothetical protein TNCV_1871501 [Trichonephila clavipes]|nr:hypothetical protein TNCV_1871501 [Trichonephila clavipes]